MHPNLLLDPDATNQLLDTIMVHSGRKVLAKLARTSKAVSEPSLNKLWQELDSFVPLISLFPASLVRKFRKRPVGLAKPPEEKDWKRVLLYGDRVRRISYDESANNIYSSTFAALASNRPREYLLPNLRQLIWKAETPAGLEGCSMFLNPGLEELTLAVGSKMPSTSAFLANMCSHTQLKSFSFSSPRNLPDDFTEVLDAQQDLEKIALVAPGALGPGVGQWAASLPKLQTLQLDLTGRSMTAVEGFFDEMDHRSGASTPTSIGSTDSGVFSGDELDYSFSEIRKSALRLTGDLRPKGAFAQLRNVHLTGEAGNMAVFLKHLAAPLIRIDLVMEDPVDSADWLDLSALLSERFGRSLQSLHITTTGSSRTSELIRSTSRVEPPSQRLSLDQLAPLPHLTRIEIDLPVSFVFHDTDIIHLAKTCPSLEVLKLSPLARFQKHPPEITLDGFAPLLKGCPKLHTLAVVINADAKNAGESCATSSQSLRRLHVGHSWVRNPLEVAVLLSQLAPGLAFLKWFNETNRPGVVEENRRGWEKVNELLPHFQKARLEERIRATLALSQPLHIRAPKLDKAVDATSSLVDRGVQASLVTRDCGTQHTPSMTSRTIQAAPAIFSVGVDARPIKKDAEVDAPLCTSHQYVDVHPPARIATTTKSLLPHHTSSMGPLDERIRAFAKLYLISPLLFILSFVFRILVSYPLHLPLRLLDFWLSALYGRRRAPPDTTLPDGKAADAASEPEKRTAQSDRSASTDSHDVVKPVRS